jgi:hypothetical protein
MLLRTRVWPELVADNPTDIWEPTVLDIVGSSTSQLCRPPESVMRIVLLFTLIILIIIIIVIVVVVVVVIIIIQLFMCWVNSYVAQL